MPIPFIGSLIEQGMNLIDSIGDKIAPDKNVELATEADVKKFVEKLKTDFKLSVMDKMLQKGTAENDAILKDVQGAREHEIRLAEMEPTVVRFATSLLRGIFRPVIGFGILGSFTFARFLAPFFNQDRLNFDEKDYIIIGIVITFYFGGRTLEKIKNFKKESSNIIPKIEDVMN
jgi:hypothetical protein